MKYLTIYQLTTLVSGLALDGDLALPRMHGAAGDDRDFKLPRFIDDSGTKPPPGERPVRMHGDGKPANVAKPARNVRKKFDYFPNGALLYKASPCSPDMPFRFFQGQALKIEKIVEGYEERNLIGIVTELHQGREKNWLRNTLGLGKSPWMKVRIFDRDTGDYITTKTAYTKKNCESSMWGKNHFSDAGWVHEELIGKIQDPVSLKHLRHGWWGHYIHRNPRDADGGFTYRVVSDTDRTDATYANAAFGAWLTHYTPENKMLWWRIFFPEYFKLFQYSMQKKWVVTNDNELFEYPFELENNMGAENPAAAMEGILTKFPLPPGNTLLTLQLDPRSELGWYRFVWYNPTELDEQQVPPELVPPSHSSTNPSDIKIDTPEPASDFEETRNFWENQPLIAAIQK